jgi:hypothetical protein
MHAIPTDLSAQGADNMLPIVPKPLRGGGRRLIQLAHLSIYVDANLLPFIPFVGSNFSAAYRLSKIRWGAQSSALNWPSVLAA